MTPYPGPGIDIGDATIAELKALLTSALNTGWVPGDAFPGGGGGTPTNWCMVAVTSSVVLSVASSQHLYTAAELSIVGQSGSDFSVGTFTGDGAVFSATGGQFLAIPYVGTPFDATLDSSSSVMRWIEIGGILGLSSGPVGLINGTGFDVLMPIIPDPALNAHAAAMASASGPGFVGPGDPVLQTVSAILIAGIGTDSVPIDNSLTLIGIWQI